MEYPSGGGGSKLFQGVVVTLFLAIIGAAGLMFLLLRSGFIPERVLQADVRGPSNTPAPLAAYLRTTPTPDPLMQITPTATRLAAPPGPRPPADPVAREFLKAWEQRRYPDMYRQLSANAKQITPEDKFVKRYASIMGAATVHNLKTSFPTLREPDRNAQAFDVQFTAVYETSRYGTLTEQLVLPLVLEENTWKVEWTPAAIFRDLTHERAVEVFYEDPTRGDIVDRNGEKLAITANLPTVGVIPGALKDRAKAITELSAVLAIKPESIQKKIDAAQPDWWVPLGVFPANRKDELTKRLGLLTGVLVEDRPARYYPHGPIGPHLIGYVSPILDDDLKTLALKGYGPEDFVGRTGVEAEFESELAGQRGGRLYIVDENGDTVRVIAERPAKDGQTLQLTLDIKTQKRTEEILGDSIGSLVLIDPRDNGVLAMATNPRFDPNGFVTGMAPDEWKKLQEDKRLPFQNRPAMSAYPTGSIFKPITMAAGMERGGLSANTPYNCGGSWSLPNSRIVFGDWQKQGHGPLDLTQGLTESCDIVFYEVGRKLDLTDPKILPEWAHLFGLGEPTGIRGITEVAGTVPSPAWKEKVREEGWYPGDAINLSIGQGYLEATPLQMANVYSALAAGGVLRKPILVKKIGPRTGNGPVQEIVAEEIRRIPMRPETLAAVYEGMRRVTQTPKGTASYAFNGYKVPTLGKTGSAENQHKEAHAWFAGIGPMVQPQVATIVMVEGGEMGGVVAAPKGRAAFESVLGTG